MAHSTSGRSTSPCRQVNLLAHLTRSTITASNGRITEAIPALARATSDL
jgi:hypothetical protein